MSAIADLLPAETVTAMRAEARPTQIYYRRSAEGLLKVKICETGKDALAFLQKCIDNGWEVQG